jgi:predicted hotdog family 3-hydroxylacyl-ACP dehydratase
VIEIGRAQIASMIPHAGDMCMLDSVLHWDRDAIRCRSIMHRAAENPLRKAGRLSGICGIEFAAQAMAVHGRLAGGVDARPQAGYLASVRDVRCMKERLDLLEGDIIVKADRLMGDEERAIYQFALEWAGDEILSGRAAVVLQVLPE